MAYSKNDIVQVTIEDIGVTGEGIGKIDGYTLFVKDISECSNVFATFVSSVRIFSSSPSSRIYAFISASDKISDFLLSLALIIQKLHNLDFHIHIKNP